MRFVSKLEAHFGSLREQDDRRLGPVVQAADRRHARGAGDPAHQPAAAAPARRVQAFDPQAEPVAKRIFGNKITLADKSYSALKGADALVIATEWNEFREPDFGRMRKLMKTPGHLRRPQHLQPGADEGPGVHVLLGGQVMAGIKGKLTNPLLSVVMPVYNERDTIEGMIARVLAVPDIRIELIVVDDGSKDGTSDILRGLQTRYPFKLFQKANGGKGSALRLGFKEVTGDLVVIQDADTEYSPEEFPELIELIVQGRADVVYGSRFLGRHRVFLFTHYLGNLLPHASDQRALQHDADRHGDLLQSDAGRSAAVVYARQQRLRHRARADGEDLQARISRLRGADHLRRPRVRRGQEDYVARRRRRAVGAAEIPLYRVNSFFRLLRYAKPYKGRLAWAVLAMVIYAVASALVIYLIRPILDELLPNRQGLRTIAFVAHRPVFPQRASGRISPAT